MIAQQKALLSTEGVDLHFTDEAVMVRFQPPALCSIRTRRISMAQVATVIQMWRPTVHTTCVKACQTCVLLAALFQRRLC